MKDVMQPTRKTEFKSLAELAAEHQLSHAQAYSKLLRGHFGQPLRAANGRWFIKTKPEPAR